MHGTILRCKTRGGCSWTCWQLKSPLYWQLLKWRICWSIQQALCLWNQVVWEDLGSYQVDCCIWQRSFWSWCSCHGQVCRSSSFLLDSGCLWLNALTCRILRICPNCSYPEAIYTLLSSLDLMALDTSSLNHGIFFLFDTILVFLGHACQWCQSEDHYIALGSWEDVSCVDLPLLMPLWCWHQSLLVLLLWIYGSSPIWSCSGICC